ncbi:MAG: hypothetical protein II939_00740, partial [Bacteroidales bacterium]|nr:hypothetical protein [Bacteroidales bacterium]
KWRFICQSIALIFYLKREVNNTGIYMDKTLDIPVSITKTLTTFSKLIPEFGIVVLKHLGKIQCLWEDYLVIKQLDCPKYSNFEELSKFAATYSIAIPDYMRKL